MDWEALAALVISCVSAFFAFMAKRKVDNGALKLGRKVLDDLDAFKTAVKLEMRSFESNWDDFYEKTQALSGRIAQRMRRQNSTEQTGAPREEPPIASPTPDERDMILQEYLRGRNSERD